MKRILYFAFVLLILISLAGCSRQQAAETDMTPRDIAAVIMNSQPELPAMTQITPEDTDFTTWLMDYYFLRAGQAADGVILYADGVEASEIAVLVLADETEAEAVQAALSEYIRNRAGVFEGYAPQQAALAKNGTVVVNGQYAALLICQDTAAAKAAFLSCFEKNAETTENHSEAGAAPTETEAPETAATEETTAAEDVYDPEAVLQAWKSGDSSSLSGVNRSILDAAEDVIDREISGGMSDYEKELAIHDFITGWSRFDYGVFGRSSADGFTDGSDTPYGVLINQSAMCHGYSSTFQLFMDMLDIECITVFGIPGSNGVEHSWDMVKLDGEWYCVDCAWDDPIGGSPCHTYFNVTSDYLRRGSIHRWDDTSVPEATGTDYAYGNH